MAYHRGVLGNFTDSGTRWRETPDQGGLLSSSRAVSPRRLSALPSRNTYTPRFAVELVGNEKACVLSISSFLVRP
jgi:hypothetical protein